MGQNSAAHAANVGSGTNEEQQGHYTHGGTIDQFKTAMLDTGITPPETIIADGSIHRFKIDGKLDGAYVLHLDGRAAGYFQDFKQGIRQNWKLERDFKRLTDSERRALSAFVHRLLPEHVKLAARILSGHPQAANLGGGNV